jgi:hypothetical protein
MIIKNNIPRLHKEKRETCLMKIRNEEQLLRLTTDIERQIVEIIHPHTNIKGESPYHM